MALLPRMDCRRQPSCWAWSLLALMAGGVASTGATVSGERGFSPRWADLEGLCGSCGEHTYGFWRAFPKPPSVARNMCYKLVRPAPEPRPLVTLEA